MIAVLVCTLVAGEIAVLTNGFELKIDRHEERDGEVVLYAGAGQTVLPRTHVHRFETLWEAPKPAPVEVPSVLSPPAPLTPREMVRSAAIRHGLPPAFVESVAHAESAFNPQAVSVKGAIGLMQLMPATAKALGVDPNDPAQNSEAGAKLLRELLLQYKDDPDQVRRALAAYNAGPGAVAKYKGVPPYRETQTYVEKVLGLYHVKASKEAASQSQ